MQCTLLTKVTNAMLLFVFNSLQQILVSFAIPRLQTAAHKQQSPSLKTEEINAAVGLAGCEMESLVARKSVGGSQRKRWRFRSQSARAIDSNQSQWLPIVPRKQFFTSGSLVPWIGSRVEFLSRTTVDIFEVSSSGEGCSGVLESFGFQDALYLRKSFASVGFRAFAGTAAIA